MSVFAALTYGTALTILVILTVRLWRNIKFLRWANSRTELPEEQPCVSVLVPARNESASITACVTSLLKQSYANYELIVLDDQSTDDTGSQLARLQQLQPQLRVIKGTSAPPAGWNGKSYACYRLAEQAAGEWLLFTDADTVHTPDSIARGLARARALDVSLLSAFPNQETGSWAEHLMVPFIVGFLPLVGLDFRRLWQGSTSRVAANGQYLLVRADIYRSLGGHASIQNALVDDFALAQRFHGTGHRLALIGGADMLSCRMYRNAREVWNGFSKNILLGLSTAAIRRRGQWQSLVFAWGYASLFVTPYLLLFLPGAWLALLVIGWSWLLRGIAAAQMGRSILEAVVTSAAAVGVMALSLNSLYLRWHKKGIVWKSRVYAIGGAPSSSLPDAAPK